MCVLPPKKFDEAPRPPCPKWVVALHRPACKSLISRFPPPALEVAPAAGRSSLPATGTEAGDDAPSFVELPFRHFDQHRRGGRHLGHLDRDGLPVRWHETQAHPPVHVSGPGTVIFLGAGLLLLGLVMRRQLPR
jgi:hypothetical protein